MKGETGSLIAKKYGMGWKAIEAANPGVVFVVLFSLPGCHYCEEVRNHYLAPLARDAANRGFSWRVGAGRD